MTDENVERARVLDTATLSDALDRLGVIGQCYKIKPRDQDSRIAGRAFTLLFGPAGKPCGTVGDFIDDVPPGHVVVIDNDGREDVTIWGDILTEIAHRRGVAGTVIDCICRDVRLCRELGYPVYSQDHWLRTGKDRIQIEGTNITVNIGQARVQPGDIMIGDADGVLVLPKEHEDAILDAAEEIHEAEEHIRESLRGGMRLDDARKKFKYQQLQTRKED